MLITIRNPAGNQKRSIAYRKQFAIRFVRTYIVKPGEYELNDYLKENYGYGLRELALLLVIRSKLLQDKANEITVLLPNKNDDKLAHLITYGNRTLPGSSIYMDAWNW